MVVPGAPAATGEMHTGGLTGEDLHPALQSIASWHDAPVHIFWASRVAGQKTDRACRASHAAPLASNSSARANGARNGFRRTGIGRVKLASTASMLGSGDMIAPMGSRATPAHALASVL